MSGSARPFAVTFNTANHRVYALSYGNNTLAVIDPVAGTLLRTVKLAAQPFGRRRQFPHRERFMFPSRKPATSRSITGLPMPCSGKVKAGTIPYAMAADSAASKIYVTNIYSNNVTVITGP